MQIIKQKNFVRKTILSPLERFIKQWIPLSLWLASAWYDFEWNTWIQWLCVLLLLFHRKRYDFRKCTIQTALLSCLPTETSHVHYFGSWYYCAKIYPYKEYTNLQCVRDFVTIYVYKKMCGRWWVFDRRMHNSYTQKNHCLIFFVTHNMTYQ